MDESIKQSIEARRSSFMNSYEIEDENLKNEINDLFSKLNKLGEECGDVREFEAKFATSPLSGEYSRLFMKMASTCKEVSMDQMFKNYANDTQKEDVKKDNDSKEYDDNNFYDNNDTKTTEEEKNDGDLVPLKKRNVGSK